MISRTERILVEAIRRSPMVTIVIPGDDGCGDTRIKVANRLFSHDVAIALQSYFNRSSK